MHVDFGVCVDADNVDCVYGAFTAMMTMTSYANAYDVGVFS